MSLIKKKKKKDLKSSGVPGWPRGFALLQPLGRSKSMASVPKKIPEDLHMSVPLESPQPENP